MDSSSSITSNGSSSIYTDSNSSNSSIYADSNSSDIKKKEVGYMYVFMYLYNYKCEVSSILLTFSIAISP